MQEAIQRSALGKNSLIVVVAALAGLAPFETAHAQSNIPERIKVGAIMPVTGNVALIGASAQFGLKLAIKDINAAGGIAGRPVDLVIADDQSTPTGAVSAATKLVSQKSVDVILGPMASQWVIASAPILTRAEIASISTAGADSLTPKFAPYHFAMGLSANVDAQAMAHYAKGQNIKSVALLFDSSPTGMEGAGDLRTALAADGIKIVGEQQFEYRSADVTPQLLSLRHGKADALMVFAISIDDIGHLQKNLSEIAWKVKVIGNPSFGTNPGPAIKIAGPDAFENTIAETYAGMAYCPSDPVGSLRYSALEKHMKDAGADPRMSLALATMEYDSVYVLKAAIEGARSVAGPKIAAWIEENAKTIPAAIAPLSASNASHFLLGPNAVAMIEYPERVRADGLPKRVDCK
jgi:branched-chain amino acid transport system substrate-binding protein